MKKKKMKKSSFIRSVNFWKVFLFFSGFFFLLIFLLQSTISVDSDRNPNLAIEDMVFTEAQTLCRIIEEKWVIQKVDRLKSLIVLMNSNFSDTQNLFEKWLKENSEFISVALYDPGRQGSIRSIQKEFWSKEEISFLKKEERQDLFKFLFGKSELLPENGSWLIGEIYPQGILDYPIISVLLSFENRTGSHILEGKYRVEGLQRLLERHISSDESIAIEDQANHTLFKTSTKEILNVKINHETGLHWTDNGISVSIPFAYLPWKFNLRKDIPRFSNRNTWFRKNAAYFIEGGFIFILILSLLLSSWIDFPVKNLVTHATEVGRGRFQARIPVQKDREMQKLAKLINYMVEEMDHMQNINVSEIINEKIKTETIIRNIADGLIVTDSKDRILVVNSVAEKWFNLKEKEVVHKLINTCLKIETFASLIQKVKQGKDKSAKEFNYRVVGERRERVFQAHASKVKGKKKEFIGIVTVIRDVTKEREADRLKTDLVSMVAHELKSPLTSIFGFSELLLESNLKDSQSKEYAQVIQTESSRLTELINKFLDLSKLEAGKTEVRMTAFDIKQVIQQVIETNRMQVEKKEIRAITDIQENLSFAFGDQDMVEQVLQNLYNNAIKYSPKRSKIGIEVKESKDEIIVNVIDNGYGIPKDALPNIFEKFYRVIDTEGYDEVEGSGLGLALTKEIVERHGGTISVKSRLGVGSVFTFTLPRSNSTLSGRTN